MTKFWIADVGHQSDIDLRAIGSPTGVNRCAVPGEATAGDPPNVYFFDLQLKRFIPPPVAVMSQSSQQIATDPLRGCFQRLVKCFSRAAIVVVKADEGGWSSEENTMKTITLTRTVLLALAASSMTLWANGPMSTPAAGSSSAPKGNSSPTRKPTQQGRMPGRGITVCYDYAYACGTGRMPSGHYLNADDLRNDRSVRSRTTYANPANARYQPGDWIVTSGGHAGYVNSNGTIDHFLQVPGRIGELYPDPDHLPPTIVGRKGGLSKNHTMEQFLNSGYRRPANVSVEVLRRR